MKWKNSLFFAKLRICGKRGGFEINLSYQNWSCVVWREIVILRLGRISGGCAVGGK
ncbi:MAG: hypothetical protein LBC74_11460 [Planctomycetaceae bacterium]|nr:hypothetical protein [Planctomycetaceae bacterium]